MENATRPSEITISESAPEFRKRGLPVRPGDARQRRDDLLLRQHGANLQRRSNDQTAATTSTQDRARPKPRDRLPTSRLPGFIGESPGRDSKIMHPKGAGRDVHCRSRLHRPPRTGGSTFRQGRGRRSALTRLRGLFVAAFGQAFARLTLAITIAGVCRCATCRAAIPRRPQEREAARAPDRGRPSALRLSRRARRDARLRDRSDERHLRAHRAILPFQASRIRPPHSSRSSPARVTPSSRASTSPMNAGRNSPCRSPISACRRSSSRRKDEIPKALTPEALANVSIGALRDSPFASLAESRFPNSPLSTYATQIEANLDLAADRVDLVIGDEMSLRDWLKTAPEASCCAVAGRVDDPERDCRRRLRHRSAQRGGRAEAEDSTPRSRSCAPTAATPPSRANTSISIRYRQGRKFCARWREALGAARLICGTEFCPALAAFALGIRFAGFEKFVMT